MQFSIKSFLIFHLLILTLLFSDSYSQDELSDSQLDSIIAKGKNEIENKEWGNAIDTFGDLLDYKPDNLTANYYYAIGQRETGKSRNPIERLLRFNSSENHFKKIIDIDSSFKDTYYQLAVLQLYRENYFEAVESAKHQLKINSSIESASTGIFHLYDVLLENENDENVENFLRSNNSEYDKYFLGEFYRRKDSLDKAETIFDSLIYENSPISLIPVYFSLVRLYVQEERYEEADKTYWKAVNSVKNQTDINLVLFDFEYILNAREYKILYSPLSLSAFKNAMKIFWTERDPLPSLPYNIRLIEHYKRLIYAEKNFRYDGLRLRIFDADQLAQIIHPPWYYLNDKFNDEGIIYIRFGEPDEQILKPSSVSETSWLYEANNKHPRMIFYFMVGKDSPTGYWTLVPMLLDPEYLKELQLWDASFHQVDPRYEYTWHRFEYEGMKTAEKGLNTDSFNWPKEIKPLNAEFTINQFRENETSDLFLLNYAVPLSELVNETKNQKPIPLKVEISIFDTVMNPVTKEVDNFEIGSSDNHVYKDMYINGKKFLLKRQKYIMSMDIRVPSENKLFGAYFNFNLSNFNDKLSCSSLEQAFNITSNGNTRDKKFLAILPNPTLKFDKSENVFAYYEIYNLLLDKDGYTDYSVNFNFNRTDTSKSIWDFISGLFGGSSDYHISIQNNYKGTSKNVSDYMAFDISKLEDGNYELKLKVKDNISGKETSSFSQLFIQKQ